jgi:hypothetical protein
MQMQRLVIACSILFFCALVSTASNFHASQIRPANEIGVATTACCRAQMLVYGFGAVPNLHVRCTMPIVRSFLRQAVRLTASYSFSRSAGTI